MLVAAVEAALAAAAVILDLAVPTFVILALMVVSLLIRRQGLSTLGFHRVPHGWALVAKMLAFAAGWTLFDIGLLKPVENHLTGTQQDMSQFMSLQGNLGMLLTWVALSWVVAGFGETLAFVGFIQTRLAEVVGSTGARLAVAIVLSSVLLGLLHTEYGIVGVTVSAVNAVFYCVLRYRYRTLWAPILAHGFIDTIGFVSFFFIGPVYGLW
jgi:membrane protease YdiL (CAAX protease family)